MSESIKSRTILYEELAEYYYHAVSPDRLTESSVQREVGYHIRNLTLLSLYFDSIIITSATVFNTKNPFVQRVISGVISHVRTREMLEVGALKILGWGGSTSSEMFDAASHYSADVLRIRRETEALAQIRSVFDPRYSVSRASDMPDVDLAEKYISRLENSGVVGKPSQLNAVVDAVQKQRDRTESLIAIEVLTSLDGVVVSEAALNTAKLQLFGVTIEHMRDEIPGLWVYSPFLAAGLSSEPTHASQGAPRAFLLSPMIFGGFLNTQIDSRTFGKLMSDSYYTLSALKNGDWKRFVEAYHRAVDDVSSALSLGMHVSFEELRDRTSSGWADEIAAHVEAGDPDMDISAFIDSLAGLGSVLLAVPVLKPVAKVLTTAVGERLSRVARNISKSAQSHVSPFILKLERTYAT